MIDDMIDSGVGAQHDYSLTISARNCGNVDSHVYDDIEMKYLPFCVRGVASKERGTINGNLHVQGVMTLGLKKHYDDAKKEEAALRKHIRSVCGWSSAVKVKITIKRLQRQQTFSGKSRSLRTNLAEYR